MLNKAKDLVTYKLLLTSRYCENLHQKNDQVGIVSCEYDKHQNFWQQENKEN